MMNRKLCLLTLAIAIVAESILAVSMGHVQAAVTPTVTVCPGGTVPLCTTCTVTVHYDSTDNQPVGGELVVCYRSSPCGCWTPEKVLLATCMSSPYCQTVQYTFETSGYYKFTWTVLCAVHETDPVYATAGPVLPETGTLLGLAVSTAALGLVFGRKRLTK